MSSFIKVCGMTEAENIRNVELQGVDMIGFIFLQKISRCLCQMPGYLPACSQACVGVFVNESKENILMYADRFPSLTTSSCMARGSPSTAAVPCAMQACTSSRLFSILLPKDLLSFRCQIRSVRLLPLSTPRPLQCNLWFRQPVRLEPPALLANGPTLSYLSGINPYSVKFSGVPPSLFRRWSTSPAASKRHRNKGCGTHLKLPERTQGRYDLLIYYLLFGCAIYATWQIVHCTW